MSLVFDAGIGTDAIDALWATRGFATINRRRAAAPSLARLIFLLRDRISYFVGDLLGCAAALLKDEKSKLAVSLSLHLMMKGEETGIRDDFARVADVVGLSDAERIALLGENPKLSRFILALEIVDVAIELFGAPEAAVAWLRGESPAEPFDRRSPLQAMSDDGSFGVEIALLHLRALLRDAPSFRARIA
jgi:hypothetical protein